MLSGSEEMQWYKEQAIDVEKRLLERNAVEGCVLNHQPAPTHT